MTGSRFRLGATLGVNQTLTWGTSFYLPAIVTGPVSTTLGHPSFQILGAFSWALIVAGIGAPRAGAWIDRSGGRNALLASIAIIAAGLAILAIGPGLAGWYLGWTVIGAGMSMGLYDTAFATASGLLGKDAGPVITGITLIAGFTSTVFWPLGTVLIGPLGWRGLLLVYAGIMLVINLPLVWFLVPPAPPRQKAAATGYGLRSRTERTAMAILGGFFAIRWFITSVIAANILVLFTGIGLTATEAVSIAALIGPGQVGGRMLEYLIGPRIGILIKARVGALLFPLGALLLLLPGPIAAAGFAVLYGMSNGIMTINRGTLPLAIFGADGYARVLGILAVPVLAAQAIAPTVAAPLVAAIPALNVLAVCAGGAAVAFILLFGLNITSHRA